ncbi:disintegrin and metalloproteinase domain-containing protein 17-like [Pungitius pungitius]|uniref:disintegrin and metalloproteinase domain-containing protein 17-like n=1 Tax=Pungitius pungitius TaxID=134920 RepID=UPI002E0D397F
MAASLQLHSVRKRDVQTRSHVERLPLWRFTDSPADGRLLVYRSDDIKNLSRIFSPKVCGYIHAEASDLLPQASRRDGDGQEEEVQEGVSHHREKRQTHDHKKNTCPLLLVADYRFFKHMGRGQESVTLNYLIELIDRVDDIYRNTTWDDEFKGYGVQINQITINNEPTKPPGGHAATGWVHYNMENSPVKGKEVWDVKKLLEVRTQDQVSAHSDGVHDELPPVVVTGSAARDVVGIVLRSKIMGELVSGHQYQQVGQTHGGGVVSQV